MIEVQILLSSYNGKNYIREQIDSILSQKNVKVTLLIRDDGSSDGTTEILKEYEKQHENIQVIYGKNLGVIKSFFVLIEKADLEKEYIAFSDQDDIWLPEKLYKAVQMLEGARKQQITNIFPLIYCSAKQLVDAELHLLPSAIHYKSVRTEFGNALVENMCTGCTCVINQDMLHLLKGKTPKFTIMYDFWIYLVGTCFGKVIYDTESYILYRQHGNNELGEASSLFESYKRRVKNFKKHRGQLTRQAEAFLSEYGAEIEDKKKLLLESFITYRKVIKKRYKFVFGAEVFRQKRSDDFIMKILILLGLI